MNQIRNLIFCLVIILGAISSNGQEYTFKSFNQEQGLKSPFVYSLTQCKDGFLWIATGDGLYSFDGIDFQKNDTTNGLASNFINSMLHFDNKIWVGHNNGEVSVKDDTGFRAIISEEIKFSGKIIALLPFKGATWAINQNGKIVKFDNEYNWEIDSINQPVAVNNALIVNQSLYIGTNESLLQFPISYEGNLGQPKKIIDGSVQALANYNKNDILVFVSGKGLLLFNEAVQADTLKEIGSQIISGEEYVSGIENRSNGNILLTTLGDGVIELEYDKNKDDYHNFKRYNSKSGLKDNFVNSCYIDLDDNPWFGHFGSGLSCLYESFFTYYYDNGKENDNNSRALLIDSLYRWNCIGNQLIRTNLITGDVNKYFLNDDHLLNSIVAYKPLKSLIVGTIAHGIFRFDLEESSFYPLVTDELSLSKRITDLDFDNDRTLYVATSNGVYIYEDLKLKKHYSTKNGLRHNAINAVYFDNKKRLWIGTKSNVLTRLSNDSLQNIELPLNIKLTTVSDITQDTQGRIWVTTIGDGVYCIQDDDSFLVIEEDILQSKYCYAIDQSYNGKIWIGHKNAITILNKDGSLHDVIDENKDIRIDLNKGGLYAYEKEMWILCKEGLINYNIAQKPKVDIAPPVIITSVAINDSTYALNNDIKLSYDQYNITFTYKAIDIANPSRSTYRYSLEGYETQWHDVGKNKVASYKKLEDGTYRFKVRAYNDKTYTEVVSDVQIVINIPFWRAWWFYVLLFFIIVACIIMLVKYREKNHKRVQGILKARIDEATKQLKEQHKNITDSIMYAKRIQDAHLPSVKILDSALDDYFIYYKPRDIVSGDFYWFGVAMDKLIIVIGDCTGHGVPGGFMTMLGISQLNSIVHEKGITDPSMILTYLHVAISEELNNEGNDVTVTDGMDIALCTIDPYNNKLTFSGARRPICMITQEGEQKIVKGTRKSIGESDRDIDFDNHHFKYDSIKSFYFFSDGIADQIGGPQEKKIGNRMIYDLINKWHNLDFPEQHRNFESFANEWTESYDFQLDDIILAGFLLKRKS